MSFHTVAVEDVGELVASVATISEALENLAFLIHADANDPALVHLYASQAEERLRALFDVLTSASPQACAFVN